MKVREHRECHKLPRLVVQHIQTLRCQTCRSLLDMPSAPIEGEDDHCPVCGSGMDKLTPSGKVQECSLVYVDGTSTGVDLRRLAEMREGVHFVDPDRCLRLVDLPPVRREFSPGVN